MAWLKNPFRRRQPEVQTVYVDAEPPKKGSRADLERKAATYERRIAKFQKARNRLAAIDATGHKSRIDDYQIKILEQQTNLARVQAQLNALSG